jgi:hypothetical protein
MGSENKKESRVIGPLVIFESDGNDDKRDREFLLGLESLGVEGIEVLKAIFEDSNVSEEKNAQK